MGFKEHILFYTLLPLLVLTIGASYVRFMVVHDYLVAYEGDCDPVTNSCFVGCEDEECTSEYYYSLVQKHAVTLEAECGVDITDCEAASICTSDSDAECSITYCDPQLDGEACESVTEDAPEIEGSETGIQLMSENNEPQS